MSALEKSEPSYSAFRNATLANFAESEDRRKMAEAIETVKKKLGRAYRFGDGQVVDSQAGGFEASLNPSQPDQIVGYVQFASEEQTMDALARCDRARSTWRSTSVEDRALLLDRLADTLEDQRWELSAWMVFEAGKNWREADADVCEAIDFCRFYAREAISLFKERVTQDVEGERNLLFYQPRGLACVIAPWNFPLAILVGMSVASLATGNCTLIKPAEQCSVIACLFAQALKAVGFPEGSFFLLPGVGEKIGPLLVDDHRVDLICFTGSVPVGLGIIETASRMPKKSQRGVKKVIAEMGGKNALIVDEDADPDEAVLGAVHSAFGFQGQKCSALSRLIVHEKIYEHFVDRFVEATKSLKMGPAHDPQFQIGPVIDLEAKTRIEKVIKAAESRLKALLVTKDSPEQGYFVGPALFVVEEESDPLFQDEIFGPVVGIMKVKDLDEALRVANSTRFALTGGFYSRSPSHIDKVKKAFEVGNLYINRSITGAVVERQPFGGFKLSGVGSKAGGSDYLLQFVEARTVTENTVRRGFAEESS